MPARHARTSHPPSASGRVLPSACLPPGRLVVDHWSFSSRLLVNWWSFSSRLMVDYWSVKGRFERSVKNLNPSKTTTYVSAFLPTRFSRHSSPALPCPRHVFPPFRMRYSLYCL